MPPASRIGDFHVCPMVTGLCPHIGGPLITGAGTVITVSMPQSRITDMAVCCCGVDTVIKGSATVIAEGMPAARIGDSTAHGGVIVMGAPTVIIGG